LRLNTHLPGIGLHPAFSVQTMMALGWAGLGLAQRKQSTRWEGILPPYAYSQPPITESCIQSYLNQIQASSDQASQTRPQQIRP
jgi:hypothetical protein